MADSSEWLKAYSDIERAVLEEASSPFRKAMAGQLATGASRSSLVVALRSENDLENYERTTKRKCEKIPGFDETKGVILPTDYGRIVLVRADASSYIDIYAKALEKIAGIDYGKTRKLDVDHVFSRSSAERNSMKAGYVAATAVDFWVNSSWGSAEPCLGNDVKPSDGYSGYAALNSLQFLKVNNIYNHNVVSNFPEAAAISMAMQAFDQGAVSRKFGGAFLGRILSDVKSFRERWKGQR